ncbi:MAG: hypothetical protein HZA25_01305, partial [Candidatus Niyogibacteria bacterium]|nr:hypothetical protein [Candidatus Niyogibacteria bacterium]
SERTTTLTNVAFNNNKLGATGYISIPWVVSGVSFLNNIKDMTPTNLF